jgi:two-component system, OmpR family, sensor histidine kinase MtrB
MRGIRGRLSVALVALVAATVLALGLVTYGFVDARLRDDLVTNATRQVQFNLSVLIPERLPDGVTAAALEPSGLIDAFRLRGGVETIVDFGPQQAAYVSQASLLPVLDALPAQLRDLVAAGHVGYAWLSVAGRPSLVVGGQPSGGPDFYFVFPADSIDSALGQLRFGLVGAALVAVALALLTAGVIAGGILGPVRSGSDAAARIAAGDLGARVAEAGGSDEFARWAAEFNRMADSLEATIGRLEASEARNRRFVAEVSHELRTPLTALVAEASLIEPSLTTLPPDARRAGELLVGDVRRLRVLVEDLMEVSRFDAGAEVPQLDPVALGPAVQEIVARRLPGASLRLPAAPLVVESDGRRLDRIIGNLLDNARAHAGARDVEVSVSVEPPDGEPATARVDVTDRGPGVPAEALPHLFERFYKGDPSRATGGSGLGLAIAAEHAALLGGSLTVEQRAGGGLRFTLHLPVTGPLPPGDLGDMASTDAAAASSPSPETGPAARVA